MRLALVIILSYLGVLLSLRTGSVAWIAFLPLPFLLPSVAERRVGGIVLGLLVDAASGHPPGTLAVCALLVVEALEQFRASFADTVLVRGTTAFIGTAATLLLLGIFRLLAILPVGAGLFTVLMSPLLQVMLPVAGLTALLGAVAIRPRQRGEYLRL
jgi:hypothetical protein